MRAFRLAYDGTGFRGFQRQPHRETVEDALFDALRDLDVLAPGEPKPEGYTAAGRTDAGVSALGQCVGFAAPDWLAPHVLNGRLPDSVRVWASADVDPDFSARFDATERRYTYHCHLPADEADDTLAHESCERLTGRHDVHNLTLDRESTVRDLSASVARDDAFLVFDLRAPAFARQQVRRVVSLVASVARSECDLAFVDRVLGDEPLDGPDGVAPAPAEGLLLRDVTYLGLAFERDETALASAREAFTTRRVRAATRERTFGSTLDGL